MSDMSPFTRARLLAVAAAVVVALALEPAIAVAAEGDLDPAPPPVAAVDEGDPGPAPAPTVFGYYTLPWSTRIYASKTDGTVTTVSAANWKASGEPKRAAPIRYVKTSWSSSRYALVTFPHEDGDTAVDDVVVLTDAQYAKAKSPQVKRVAHVPTSTYSRYASSAVDLYVRTPDGERHKLTSAQYKAAGSPAPKIVYGGYYRVKWSKKIYFVPTKGAKRAVTSAQYKAAGRPRVAIAPTVYVKTPYSPVHALVTWPNKKGDAAVDQVVRLTSAQYKAAGSPKAEKRTRIPGDSFVRLKVGKTIYHLSKGFYTPVTTAQYKAAGAPKVKTVKPAKPTYVRGILIVNKSLPVPSTYGDGLRPELKKAFSKMQAAARRDGVSLWIISGYRSYASQKSIHASRVRQLGRSTGEKLAARPGHSEHQTGLAIDINSISQAWGKTKAGKWVAKHGPSYGFIVRYPKGKTKVTGYSYEPWHLRYVGPRVATHLAKDKLTLEEYLRVPSKYAK